MAGVYALSPADYFLLFEGVYIGVKRMSREFDLSFREESVLLSRGGERLEAVLREMSGREREDYLNSLQSHVNFSRDGSASGVKSITGLTSLLLTSCMFWRVGDELVRVTDKELNAFPSRVLTELTELANELNGFTVVSMEAAIKN
ncbi:MAG: hypothetical protein LBP59_10875 [Planctomycetaceae bacterium]|nr:hypothetical protein [Planctomycetaceae bacterium]